MLLAQLATKLIKQIVGSRFHSNQPVSLAVTHGEFTHSNLPFKYSRPEKKSREKINLHSPLRWRKSVKPQDSKGGTFKKKIFLKGYY